MFEVEKEHSQFDFNKKKTVEDKKQEELQEFFNDLYEEESQSITQSNSLINLILWLSTSAVLIVFLFMFFV